MQWAYGITTVPERRHDLLPATIDSLARAGFDRPVLFVDGQIANYNDLEIVCHSRVGQLLNWMNGLFYLYTTSPKADRYAIFEDDIVACRQLRKYLEQCPLPERVYWNLLTHNENLVFTKEVRGWHESNQLGRGAAGLVFDRKGVESLLRVEQFLHYPRRGGSMSDAAVVSGLKPIGYRELIHYPSLIQHVGINSTIGHSYGLVRGFLGEDYDLLSIGTSVPPIRKATQCKFERHGDFMVCVNQGCGRRIRISDPLLLPELYRARCKSQELQSQHCGDLSG